MSTLNSVGEQTDDRIFAGREIQTKLFGLISYEYVLIFVGGVNFTSTVLHAYYTRYGTYEPHILVVVKVIWFVLALIGVLRKVSVCMAACMVCNLINGVIYCITVFAAHNFREFLIRLCREENDCYSNRVEFLTH
ncbi:hypothetical protein DICVIV_00377 [Dictyocaulus viviparus]|uniref:Uncharacterized protein n=1 Tax=Dictyocaulus viviparus TaxID=29172 RepID=A0A0D8YBM7_DICVI|nr:hypothetical protein DICVIV_00377 [Dictyocaulus viviparus]